MEFTKEGFVVETERGWYLAEEGIGRYIEISDIFRANVYDDLDSAIYYLKRLKI